MARGKGSNERHAFFWQADYEGCGYVRCEVPSDALNTVPGWSSSSDQLLSAERFNDGSYDIVTCQRISKPEAFKLWRSALEPEAPATVYELDDNLLAVEPHNATSFAYYSDIAVRERIAAGVAMADAVSVSTEPLARVFGEYNPNVYVIPNYLPARHLREPVFIDRRPVVGWAGSNSHLLDMASIVGALNSEDVRFKLYGTDYRHVLKIPHAEYVPWQVNADAYMASLDLDIGLCPLVDSEFNRSKTPLKALEYFFKGIPCIASNVTPYREFVIPGVTGFLCDTPREWRQALDKLVNDRELRERMSRDAYAFAKLHTAELHAPVRAAIYDEVIAMKQEIRAPKVAQIKAVVAGYRPDLPRLKGVR